MGIFGKDIGSDITPSMRDRSITQQAGALVSIVVPSKNKTKDLSRLLETLEQQTVRPFEIIVVASGPTGDLDLIAARYNAVVAARDCGMSEARNIGASLATGRYLLFLDSDMLLSPSVVEECLLCSEAGFDPVIIPEISVGRGFWAKCKQLEKECYLGDDAVESARFFGASLFRQLGGYDSELLAGEDMDMTLRARSNGARVGRARSMIYHNEGHLTLAGDVTKKFRYGRTLKRYAAKQPAAFRRQRRLLRPAFLRNLRTISSEPLVGAGLIFLKSCELFAYAVGMVWSE